MAIYPKHKFTTLNSTEKKSQNFLYLLVFTVIHFFAPSGFADLNLWPLEKSCPYTQTPAAQKCGGSENNVKEVAYQSAQAACIAKTKSKLCGDARQEFSFLAHQTNNCDAEGICGFPYPTDRKKAIESCKRGLDEAARFLGKEISDSEKILEKLTLSYGEELLSHMKQSATDSWVLFKNCLNDKSNCSPSQLQKYIDALPAQIKKEIAEMNQAIEQYECFDSSGRYQLFCYQSAIQASGLAVNVLPGRAFERIGSKIIRISRRVDQTPDSLPDLKSIDGPEIKLKGIERLENSLGRKVETAVSYQGSTYRPVFQIKDSTDGKVIGALSVQYDPDNKTIKIGSMTTNKEFRKMGVGESLLEAAIKKFPDVEDIYVDLLEETNRDVIDKARSAGMPLEEAIKQSPAYKMRSNLGFGEIVPGSIDYEDYSFKVRRPHK